MRTKRIVRSGLTLLVSMMAGGFLVSSVRADELEYYDIHDLGTDPASVFSMPFGLQNLTFVTVDDLGNDACQFELVSGDWGAVNSVYRGLNTTYDLRRPSNTGIGWNIGYLDEEDNFVHDEPEILDNHGSGFSNVDYAHGYGAVGYRFQISENHVTAAHYVIFLNAVAKYTDPHTFPDEERYGLYYKYKWNAPGASWPQAAPSGWGNCILREGAGTVEDPFTYKVVRSWANTPITHMAGYAAMRFSNWLTTSGTDPENAVYEFDPDERWDRINSVAPNPTTNYLGAFKAYHPDYHLTHSTAYRLPTPDEFFKAAYYHPHEFGPGQGGYRLFSFGGRTLPLSLKIEDYLDSENPSYLATNAAAWKAVNHGEFAPTSQFRVPVGSYTQVKSYYGLFDVDGNADDTVYDSDKAERRGGNAWVPTDRSIRASAVSRSGGGLDSVSYLSGFRIVRMKAPGTILILR